MSWYVGANRNERLLDVLDRNQFDALVSLFPENSAYLTGGYSYIATHWRLPGMFTAAVGKNGTRAMVTPDFGRDPRTPSDWLQFPFSIWTESVDVRGIDGPIAPRIVAARPETVERPSQFDLNEIVDRVVEAIRSVSGPSGRVGIELRNVGSHFRFELENRLAPLELVEATDAFDDLRVLKDPDEIEALRLAAELTEIGIAGAIEHLRIGQSETAVNAAYQRAVHDAVIAGDRFRTFRQAEGAASVGFGADSLHIVRPGETIKFDMQVDVGGYHSDIGRTVAFAPTGDQAEIYEVLLAALRTAERAVKPGATFAAVYWAGTNAVRGAGFANYSRGHLGHSVGLTQNFEEPPFIAPGEQRILTPGMVISLELPYYVYGLGAFQLERMLLISDDGFEPLDRLPFEFALPITP